MFRMFSFILAAAVFVGCTTKTRISYDYNQDFDFASIQSFHLLSASGQDAAGLGLTEQRVQRAISDVMVAKQKAGSQKENADIWVSYMVTTEDKTRIRSYHSGFAYGRYSYRYGGAFMHQDIQVTQYSEGQLILDLIDPKTNHVVWRGIGKRNLSGVKPTEGEAIVRQAVEALFETVPGWKSEADNSL